MIKIYWKILSFVALLILTISACSNPKAQDIKSNSNSPDDEFEYRLNYFLEDDIQAKVAYEQVFGKEKSIQEAKEYCNKLDKGKSQLALQHDISDDLTKKFDEDKITKKEQEALFKIYFMIYRTAQDIYCPQHRDKDQIPLNERLK